MQASPINPSDSSFVSGTYGVKRELPCTPGFEGSGTVVASGGGIMAWTVLNKRVAFAHQQPDLEGCWAQYAVVPAINCVSIGESVSFEVRRAARPPRRRAPPALTPPLLVPRPSKRPPPS